MTHPSHDYDGLETPSTDPSDWFLDDLDSSSNEDDVNDCVEDEDFDDVDLI